MSVIEPHASTAQLGFHRVGAAAPATVVAWRGEFAAWLRNQLKLDDERHSDVILAVDEALSNAAEFAYRDASEGEVTLDVRYSHCDARLNIAVSDRGNWREADPTTRSLARGRGLQLMRALADYFDLEQGSAGTRVKMAFERCPSMVAESA
jgi:serine/threonine-protein kinase RsbW